MHEVAEPTTVAFAVFILAAARFSEIRHGGEFSVERPTYWLLDGGCQQ